MLKWFNNLVERRAMQREIKALRRNVSVQDQHINTLRRILGGNLPGQWASDHYQETLKYRAWVYCCINAIMVQMRQSELQTKMDEDNYACSFLKSPNPFQSRKVFEARRAQQLNLTGSCVVWNVPERYVEMPERYIIPTGLLQAVREGYFRFSMTNFSTVYWNEIPARLMDVILEKIPFDEVTLYRFDHPLNLGDGFAPVAAGAYWIDVADQIDIARFNYNANAMRPGGVLEETEECRMKAADWDRFEHELYANFSGAENHGKFARMPRGIKLIPWMRTAEELQHQESFIQQRDAIFALFGVPPIAAGVTEASSYSAFYAAMLQFAENVIQPLLDFTAAEDKRVLESPMYDWCGFHDIDEFRYRARRLDDPDVKDKEERRVLDFIKEKMASGAYTRDEIRAFFGDGPLTPGAVTYGVSRYGMVRQLMPEAGAELVDTNPQPTSVEESVEQGAEEQRTRIKPATKDDSGIDRPAKKDNTSRY